MAIGSNPPVGFHFRVEFGLLGITDNDNRFRDVSGLSADIQSEPLREGGENRFIHQLPTVTDYQILSLKRGMSVDSRVIEWVRDAIENFNFQPVDIVISLLNQNHEPLRSWQAANAWPKKWSISDFNAQDDNLVIETLDLKYSYLKIL